MSDIYQIAIDGPSGAGKSTIAKAVASRLNIDYIDTGAMYRAIGYKADKCGVAAEDEAGLREMLSNTSIDFSQGNIILDGENVNGLIRTPEVSMLASKYSAIAVVREMLVDIQREMGTRKSVIMDGRDICSNVLKDAVCKIYLSASAEERADRRFKELQEKGSDQSYEDVLADIKRRDYNDMNRALNPLVKAPDAVEIDSTGMSIEEVVQAVIDCLNEARAKA